MTNLYYDCLNLRQHGKQRCTIEKKRSLKPIEMEIKAKDMYHVGENENEKDSKGKIIQHHSTLVKLILQLQEEQTQ